MPEEVVEVEEEVVVEPEVVPMQVQ